MGDALRIHGAGGKVFYLDPIKCIAQVNFLGLKFPYGSRRLWRRQLRFGLGLGPRSGDGDPDVKALPISEMASKLYRL
ncbi:GTPase MTG2 [Apiospora arundinis]